MKNKEGEECTCDFFEKPVQSGSHLCHGGIVHCISRTAHLDDFRGF